jgi:hypothetical protein
MPESRAALLRAALGFLSLEPRAPELRMLHEWLDSWTGIGHIATGMARQGYDLELRRYDGQGWRVTFYPEGFEHSRTVYSGSATALTPWLATQRAAMETLRRRDVGEPAPRDWTLTDESPT